MWLDLPPPDPAVEARRRSGTGALGFSAGVSRKLAARVIDVRPFGTAQAELGDVYRGRAVASLRTSF